MCVKLDNSPRHSPSFEKRIHSEQNVPSKSTSTSVVYDRLLILTLQGMPETKAILEHLDNYSLTYNADNQISIDSSNLKTVINNNIEYPKSASTEQKVSFLFDHYVKKYISEFRQTNEFSTSYLQLLTEPINASPESISWHIDMLIKDEIRWSLSAYLKTTLATAMEIEIEEVALPYISALI